MIYFATSYFCHLIFFDICSCAKNSIPSIFYFSGLNEDYHKHTDTMEKLSYKKIESLTKLIFYTAWELSNAEKRPVVDKINEFD